MIVVDLNLLLYAVNVDEPRHTAAREWWESTLSGEESVGLPWAVLLGFLRISTHPKVMPRPLDAEAALEIVSDWLAQPNVRTLEPTEKHWGVLEELLRASGTAGNLTTDAHLAALAIEHGARLASSDHDFARFEKLRWMNPLGRVRRRS